MKSIGIDLEAPVDPAVMIEDIDYYDFFANVARNDPHGIGLPLRVGESMRCDDYGAFGLAWKSALNLRGSCDRAERYGRIHTTVSTYQVVESDKGCYMQLHRDGDRQNTGLRLSNETTIASIASICREVSTEDVMFYEVFFQHDAPSSTSAHDEYFNCPVSFNASRDALHIAAASMQTPNRLGDASIVRFFDTHLEEKLSKKVDESSLERRVRTRIAQSLSDGIPTVSDVAGHLGMSGRTLQRRLTESGYTYQALVDASRRQLAERLLRETTYPLAEIAFLTGFSEQSAFNRAFRRWAGQTPRSYRLRATPG